VLLAAGGRALLMQLAHPKVAAGVADHSRFQDHPFDRLYRTMNAMWSIVFDEQSRARTALESLERRHRQVRGVVPSREPSRGGTPYDALDQELLLWVHATLIDSAMIAFDRFVRALPSQEKIAYYDDSKELASLFGIDQKIVPTSLRDFDAYMERMLNSNVIAVGPTAKNLARDILYAWPRLFRPAGPMFRFVTSGLLPEKLRHGYDLNWSKQREKRLALLAAVIRSALPLVPSPLRIVPNARAAEKDFRRQSRLARKANE